MEALPVADGARLGPRSFFPIARAGLEMDIRAAGAPYIVKTPFLCDLAEEVLTSSLHIEHAIIPVRRFAAAAASRTYVQQLSTGNSDGDPVPGGLWNTDRAELQADVLRLKFTNLIETLVHHDIPMTFLMYPRLVTDPDYLYRKLSFLLEGIDQASFRTTFDRTVRPEWIHQFTAEDR